MQPHAGLSIPAAPVHPQPTRSIAAKTSEHHAEDDSASDAIGKSRTRAPNPITPPDNRRAGDEVLYLELLAADFTGPRYEIFQSELVAYAVPVLMHWLETGKIYRECAARGRPVYWKESERAVLRDDAEEREKIATSAVARTLRFFRDDVLVGARWRPDGGASLRTFFVGAVLLRFNDVYETWVREHRQQRRCVPVGFGHEEDQWAFLEADGQTPEEIATGNDRVHRYINSLKSETDQAIVTLAVYHSLTHEEIAAQLGINPGAVTMRIQRLRKAYRRAGR